MDQVEVIRGTKREIVNTNGLQIASMLDEKLKEVIQRLDAQGRSFEALEQRVEELRSDYSGKESEISEKLDSISVEMISRTDRLSAILISEIGSIWEKLQALYEAVKILGDKTHTREVAEVFKGSYGEVEKTKEYLASEGLNPQEVWQMTSIVHMLARNTKTSPEQVSRLLVNIHNQYGDSLPGNSRVERLVHVGDLLAKAQKTLHIRNLDGFGQAIIAAAKPIQEHNTSLGQAAPLIAAIYRGGTRDKGKIAARLDGILKNIKEDSSTLDFELGPKRESIWIFNRSIAKQLVEIFEEEGIEFDDIGARYKNQHYLHMKYPDIDVPVYVKALLYGTEFENEKGVLTDFYLEQEKGEAWVGKVVAELDKWKDLLFHIEGGVGVGALIASIPFIAIPTGKAMIVGGILGASAYGLRYLIGSSNNKQFVGVIFSKPTTDGWDKLKNLIHSDETVSGAGRGAVGIGASGPTAAKDSETAPATPEPFLKIIDLVNETKDRVIEEIIQTLGDSHSRLANAIVRAVNDAVCREKMRCFKC